MIDLLLQLLLSFMLGQQLQQLEEEEEETGTRFSPWAVLPPSGMPGWKTLPSTHGGLSPQCSGQLGSWTLPTSPRQPELLPVGRFCLGLS